MGLAAAGLGAGYLLSRGPSSHPPPAFPVSFYPAGLASGTSFSVTFNGVKQSASSPAPAVFYAADGTYPWSATPPPGYTLSPSSGSVTVNDSKQTVTLEYSATVPPPTYSLDFTETGLPSGTLWTAILGGTSNEATAPSPVAFTEAAGTYPWSIPSPPGYSPAPASGSAQVPQTSGVPVAFSAVTPPPPSGSIQHVFVAYLENEPVASMASAAPYLWSLYQKYGQARNYYGLCHPSAPNYLGFACGASLQCGSDSCHPGGYDRTNLIDLIEDAGLDWIAYGENATVNCPDSDNGLFLCRHYPWTYFSDVLGSTSRCLKCVPIASILGDYPYTATPPAFTWLGLNADHDGHNASGGGIPTADQYMAQLVPKMMAQPWWANSILFITTDEDTKPTGYTASDGTVVSGGQVFTVAVSPFSVGKSYTPNATHYNLAASVMDILGLAGPMGEAATAAFPPMRSLYS